MRIVLGLLLVTAAGLKLSGLNVTALPRAGWFVTPPVQVAAAEWELVLGIWLLSGAAQYFAWLAALGTFLGFAMVSAYFGWVGVSSCACFGAIQTSPWTAFGVDVAVLVALLIGRPDCRARSASEGERTLARAAGSYAVVPLGAAVILLALTGIGTWVYGSPAAALAAIRREPLQICPTMSTSVSGVVRGIAVFQVCVLNGSKSARRIIGGTLNCRCNAIEDLPVTVPAGQSRVLEVHVRLADDVGWMWDGFHFYTDDPAQWILTGFYSGQVTASATGPTVSRRPLLTDCLKLIPTTLNSGR